VFAANALASDVIDMINNGEGIAVIETVGGCLISAKISDDKVTFSDAKGTVATVEIADIGQSNGVMHVIDAVLLP